MTREMVQGLEQQTRQILSNIKGVLESAGCSFANIVKTTIYIKNISDFGEFNKIYAEYFKENPPARTTVGVSGLPKDALIEIEVIAHR